MKLRTLLGLAVALAVLSCSEDRPDDTTDRTLEEVSGDSQSVAISAPSAPLVVRVVSLDGDPIAGELVEFSLELGAGALTAYSDTTDADGLASTTFAGSTVAGLRRIGANMLIVGTDAVIFDLNVGPGTPSDLFISAGDEQGGNAGMPLATQLAARVTDGFANNVAGVWVKWGVESGGGTLSVDSSLTNASGVATVTRTLGAGAGGQVVRATVGGLADTLRFHATARKAMTVLAGGNNVPQHYTSDLWVRGNYAYTGTWGSRGFGSHLLKVWDVSSGVTLVDTISVGAGTLSDSEVSPDGTLLLSTSELGGAPNGLYLHSLADPAHPAPFAFEAATGFGLHTGTFAEIGGELYVLASRNSGAPALMVYRIQPDSADKIVQVAAVNQPADYGIHDQYVRDGLAFASVWNTGLRIYDVGNGMSGGTPAVPVLVGGIVTGSSGLTCNCVHNAWWYHDTTGAKRYLFVGQEGPGSVGNSSSGDIHVVDVTNMASPEEVATFSLGNDPESQPTGVHNFWMDEERGILYAAYYNGGVVALDVTGTLSGNLANREIARIRPAGNSTYVWGVMLANGALWASDMLTGLWKLSPP
jgi:hypothetical protein